MENQQFFKEQTEKNIIKQILERYLPFWPLFVITVVISLSITFVYLRSQVPVYVASAKVLLKDPNKGSGDSKILDALNIFGERKIVDNEIVVIRSTNLIQEVVKDLNLYSSVYNEGRVRIEELYKENSPITFLTSQPANVLSSPKYYFTVDWNRNQITIADKTVHFNDSVLLNNTSFKIVPNLNYNKTLKGKNYYVQFSSIVDAASNIIANLKANPISNQSTVLDLKLETPTPAKGIDILTRLFEEYNSAGIQDKNQIAARTLAFIDSRLLGVTYQLDSVERGVQSYKASNQIVDLPAQGQIFLTNVSDLDKQKTEIDIQLDVIKDINSYIDTKDKKPGSIPSVALLNDPILATLLEKLHQAEIQLQRNRSIAGEKSDAVILAEQEVNNLNSNIRTNIASVRRNLLSARGNINSSIGAASNILRQMPQKERGLIDISRQQSIKNSIYTYLLQKREETALNSASTIADLRVIEKAAAYGPIKPVPKNFYMTGFIVGVLLAAFVILVREQLNRKVLFRTEIEEKTTVPVIGEIIQIASKDPIVILEGKRTIIAEQFRSLRTNLSFMALSEDAKTTLITSNISGEGKSFVSINLAISYTLTDKKVALLELDLRKPRLSNLLKVQRDPGISNFLVGKIPIEGIIKETSIKNLYVISAGAIPPNPSELILSDKFKEMINELKNRFDFLIIDSAPVGPVSDSLLLKNYADTTIFVVRHNVTPKNYIKQIDNLHQKKLFKNMCIVFNGLKRRGFGGNYGYGYGNYGYGNYGYGNGENGGGYYVKEEKKSIFSGFKNIFRR